jgi:hypothetical protein
MARPSSAADIDPSITSARRYRFLRERAAERDREDGAQAVFRSLRLATTGTTLPATFPSRAALITAGVLAVEEVVGAGLDELRSYGLGAQQAATLTLWLHRYSTVIFSYGPLSGQHYEQDEITLLTSAARTASGVSDTYEVGDRGTLRLDLDVTAVSGSGTVHCQIETRPLYGSGDWRVVDAFPVQSAAGSVRRSMSGCDRFVRAVYTIGGTSVTFSLTGEAV